MKFALAATSTADAYEHAQATRNATDLDIADKFFIIADTARKALATSMQEDPKRPFSPRRAYIQNYADKLNDFVIDKEPFNNMKLSGSFEYIEMSYQQLLRSAQTENFDISQVPALPLDLFLRPLLTPRKSKNYFIDAQSTDPAGTPELTQREAEFAKIQAQRSLWERHDRARTLTTDNLIRNLRHFLQTGGFEKWKKNIHQRSERLESDIEKAKDHFQETDKEITIIEATPAQRQAATLEAARQSNTLLTTFTSIEPSWLPQSATKQSKPPSLQTNKQDMQNGQRAARNQETNRRANMEKNRDMVHMMAQVIEQRGTRKILKAASIRAQSVEQLKSSALPPLSSNTTEKNPIEDIIVSIKNLNKVPCNSQQASPLTAEIIAKVQKWRSLPDSIKGTCIINQEEYPLSHLNVLACCGQTIHPQPMLDWFTRKHSCPGCRKDNPSFHPFPLL